MIEPEAKDGEKLIGQGEHFALFTDDRGARIVRLFDGAEATFYGSDRYERFMDNFSGEESPDSAEENADETDEVGMWAGRAGEFSDPPATKMEVLVQRIVTYKVGLSLDENSGPEEIDAGVKAAFAVNAMTRVSATEPEVVSWEAVAETTPSPGR